MNAPARKSAQPTYRRKGHLEAVPTPKGITDRRGLPYFTRYLELTLPAEPDPRSDAKRRYLGFGLKEGPAELLSALIELIGTEMDGRRGSFALKRRLNGDFLIARYGWTYEKLAGWVGKLERPCPCPHCERGHALARVTRGRRGESNAYALVRCQDVADDECVSFEEAIPKKRVRTGAIAGNNPRKVAAAVEKTAASDTLWSTAEPLAVADRRTQLALAVAAFHEIELPPQTAAAIAAQVDASGAGQSVGAYEGAVLRVSLHAGMQHVALGAVTNEEVAELVRRGPLCPGAAAESVVKHDTFNVCDRPEGVVKYDTFSTGDRDVDRILELARRAEPRTAVETARSYHAEFVAQIRSRGVTDGVAIGAELRRLLNDRRVVGPAQAPFKKPIARIRAGLKDGYLWTHEDLDDGTSAMARAYAGIPPGMREAVEAHVRDRTAARLSLDRAYLKRMGVASSGMVEHVKKLVAGEGST